MFIADSFTKSLMHFDGADSSNVFKDEIAGYWGRVNAVLSTAQAKFGPSSGYFASNSVLLKDYDTLMSFGTGDFTVDFWVRPINSGVVRPFFDNRLTNSALPLWLGRAADSTLRSYDGTTLRTGGAITQDVWSHIAWCRVGTANRIYVNGTAQHIFTNGADYGTTNSPWIGQDHDGIFFTGYIDEFRITVGKSLWSADFSVPTAPMGYFHQAARGRTRYCGNADPRIV